MEQYIVPALVGLVGVIAGALIQGAFSVKKNDAEINQMITESVTNLIAPLNSRIDDQELEITDLKIDLKDWRDCAEERGNQLIKADITPAQFKSSRKK